MTITAKKRRSLKPSQFGLPSEHKYPVDTRGRAIAAKAYAAKEEERGKLSPSTKAQIVAKANRALGKRARRK